MPSHPERVRRNYHKITIIENEHLPTNEFQIHISISKREIASWMTKYEVEQAIFRLIKKGIYGSNLET